MKKFSWIFFFTFIFSSCGVNMMRVYNIEMDSFVPAKITFDSDVVNVAIVNNVTDAKVEPFSFEKKKSENGEVKDTVFVTLSDTLVGRMNAKQYFNKVELYPERIRENDYSKDVRLLTDDEVISICETMDADILISIDKFVVNEKVEVVNPLSYTRNFELQSFCQASIFRSSGEIYPSSILIRDTIFQSVSVQYEEDPIKTHDDSRKSLAIRMADNLAAYLIPSLKKQERWFYSYEKKDVESGRRAALEGNWILAKMFWERELEKERSGRLKARLAFNIALAYECLDDLDNAIEYAQKSYDYLGGFGFDLLKEDIKYYQKQLKERNENIDTLHEQIGAIANYEDSPDNN